MKLRILSIGAAILFVLGTAIAVNAEQVVIDFEQVAIQLDPADDEKINRLEVYEEQGVEFRLAREPEKSKSRGRIMFFPHLASGRQGILNAMANEQEIPVRVRFPDAVSAVTIRFWASTGAAARLEAFDENQKSVDVDALDVVPSRQKPEDPIPMFELSVRADKISYVEFSGTKTGEYLAADEVRYTPLR